MHAADEAERRMRGWSDVEKHSLASNIGAGLPGSAESYSLDELRAHLARYAGMDADALRRRLIDFLSEAVPAAERLGMRLCCHPDDPPWPLLGLPRVMSTEQDYQAVLDAVLESETRGGWVSVAS